MKTRHAGVLLVAAAALSGCSGELRIGVVLPETGDAAVYGATIKQGIQLAFEQGQANGRIPENLLIEYRDSRSQPDVAAALAKELYDQGALAVIGGVTTAEALAMVPVADRAERILMSPSASAPELSRNSLFFFRTCPSDDLEGPQIVKILTRSPETRAVLIIQEPGPYASGLLPVVLGEMRKRNVEVCGTAPIQMTDADWEKKLHDRITSRQPPATFVCASGGNLLAAVRALRAIQYNGLIVATSGLAAREIIRQGGAALEGVFFPMVAVNWIQPKDEIVKEFLTSFQSRYGVRPDIFAAQGYDAALAVGLAYASLSTRSGKDLQLRLKGLGETAGVTGNLAFDDYGSIKHFPRTYWIRNGAVDDFEQYLEEEKKRLQRQWEELMSGRR
ncbi:MAG: amino acid ABC transporter substrate-binding protein [Acidobacteriota bacterium]|jgi:branched-chain amino acid transport system substrate-binding protein